MIIVILVISIVWISVRKLYNNQGVMQNQSELQNNITMLKYSIWNLPQDINNVVIDNIYKFKPINSVLIQINKNWINKYKYITSADYRNILYNNATFLWFNNVRSKQLDYDKSITVNWSSVPILISKKESNWLVKKRFDTKLTDFWYIQKCYTYKDWTIRKEFNLENNGHINILLTSTNDFLVSNNKIIDWDNNFIIRNLYCSIIDPSGNAHKIILNF